jgi:hypothetical protein
MVSFDSNILHSFRMNPKPFNYGPKDTSTVRYIVPRVEAPKRALLLPSSIYPSHLTAIQKSDSSIYASDHDFYIFPSACGSSQWSN